MKQWFHAGNMFAQNEYITPSTRWQAFVGTLPFLGFGILSMLGNLDRFHDVRTFYIYLAYYALVLAGLLIGWIRGFPLWSYSYLGWSLIFIWWLAGARINNTYFGSFFCIPFGLIILIALLWTRTIKPIKKFFGDLATDFSRLSLAIYTLIAFVFLIYDENHHPYLLPFITAATLAISAGAWFFLRAVSLKVRIFSMFGGLVSGYLIGTICDRTWDAAAYYGFSEGPPDPWYQTLYQAFMILVFFSGILLWPVVISSIQRINSKQIQS